jgi:hypothetical protein
MAQQKIELRKVRDFGQNFNDTFVFLRQNIKPLLKSFFAICGLFMLGHAIANGIYQSHSFGVFDEIFKGGRRRSNYPATSPYAGIFSLEYFLTILFMFLTYVSMKTVLGAYFKYYLENNGEQPGIDQIWEIFRRYFFRVALYSIPVAILTILGFCLCLLPGLYLWVVWVPFSLVVVIEDTTFNGAFNRCFEIVRENFWISLAIYVVAYLIFYMSSGVISIVVGIIVGAATYLTTESVGATAGIVTSFLNIFSFIFYIPFFVSAAFQYFNLVEQKDGTGILSRIDSIGSEKNRFDNIEEQY